MELLHIFKKVQNKIPKTCLWFTGDGIMKQKLIDKIKELKLENVIFHCAIPQKENFSLKCKNLIFLFIELDMKALVWFKLKQ